ncbi:Isonitrile hydratase [Marinibacterium anthonyi]|nr:Isonitrile hydratase [Marinibacterium anthonyi]
MRTVGAVLFPGFEMLDLYGPLEMYALLSQDFEIRTVAETPGPVAAKNGPATLATDGFGDNRAYDLLLIPGGSGTRTQRHNTAMTDWLARAAERTEWVTTVCTGSMLFAATGLLDRRRATTNKLAFGEVADAYPAVDWQPRARWVRDGQMVTSSGISAGMDMTLSVIAMLLGPDRARDVARWAEYTAVTDPDNDPFCAKDAPE